MCDDLLYITLLFDFIRSFVLAQATKHWLHQSVTVLYYQLISPLKADICHFLQIIDNKINCCRNFTTFSETYLEIFWLDRFLFMTNAFSMATTFRQALQVSCLLCLLQRFIEFFYSLFTLWNQFVCKCPLQLIMNESCLKNPDLHFVVKSAVFKTLFSSFKLIGPLSFDALFKVIIEKLIWFLCHTKFN